MNHQAHTHDLCCIHHYAPSVVGFDLLAFGYFAETLVVGVTAESKQVHNGYVFIWFWKLANTICALQDIPKPFVVVFRCLDKFESQARPFIRHLIICITEISPL